MYKIIEDHSPYYITFTFDGLDEIIEFVKNNPPTVIYDIRTFVTGSFAFMNTYDLNTGSKILDLCPFSKLIDLKKERVSIFESMPHGGFGIHKDGSPTRFGINLPIEISDDKCITRWYSDSLFDESLLIGMPYTRSIHKNFRDLDQFETLKTVSFKSSAAVLFNTDIYHSVDNTNSPNARKILTFRAIDNNITFNDAKKLLWAGMYQGGDLHLQCG